MSHFRCVSIRVANLCFCSRAKLFRFGDGQWKERCKGDLRLLKDKASGRVRVVMREDLMAALLRANHAVPPSAELVWNCEICAD